ncbi:MAG: phosphoadenosine phosphosulfate reductase family protein [Thermoplasmata archaeon]
MSGPVYFGRIMVKWCDECGVPVLGKRCDICNNVPREMKITPPGETRISFEDDLKRFDKILDGYLKTHFSELVRNYFVLLNRIPHDDRAEEVILYGETIFTVFYMDGKNHVSLRPKFYTIFREHIKGKWVIADRGACGPIREGKNLMWPGVKECSDDIEENDDVFVLDENGECIATGIFKKSETGHGVAVKIKHINDGREIKKVEADLNRAINANLNYLKNIEEKAVREIKKLDGKNVLVSFSGGKDSLVSLYLTILSGIRFRAFFLNTGLEFPETVDYVRKISIKYGIDMDIIDSGNSFFNALEHFGPPGRDYRWCCKVCKLGPTTRYLIDKGEVYVIIGQRKYESFTRYRNSNYWENEWVPNQKAFSPIQEWDSLSVWLYILFKKLEYNTWYERGMWRIGCYLCPSQDMGDFEIVREYNEKFSEWENYLYKYFRKYDNSEMMVSHGLWRWNKLPEHIKKKYGVGDIERESLKTEVEFHEGKALIKINKMPDEKRLKNMLRILPEELYKNKENHIEADGSVYDKVLQIIYQAEECVGCGICTGRCRYNAIELRDNRAWIVEDLCMGCSACLGPCPAFVFGGDHEQV